MSEAKNEPKAQLEAVASTAGLERIKQPREPRPGRRFTWGRFVSSYFDGVIDYVITVRHGDRIYRTRESISLLQISSMRYPRKLIADRIRRMRHQLKMSISSNDESNRTPREADSLGDDGCRRSG